jgi:alkylation response protein AidB-like acyl-CoA dehydrogenase
MSNFRIDRRDIDFVLFEQLGVDALAQSSKYQDFTREVSEMILTEANKFASDILGPANQQSDREGCRLENGQVYVPKAFKEIYRKFAQGGWVGPTHSPDYGGQNMPVSLYIACTEMFVGACASFYFYPGLTTAAGHLIESFGTEKLVNLFVKKMYTGTWSGTMCLTEPGAGSAVGDLKSTAELRDDGTYSIAGTKIFISGGDHDLTDNIVHLVLARVKGDPSGIKGISLFVVPKKWVNDDGSVGEMNDVQVGGIEHKMGINGCSTCVLNFGENNQCRGYLIGKQREGIVAMFQMMNEARILCGLQGAAAANAAYQAALGYAKERVQGTHVRDFKDPEAPRVAIIEHPDVRRMLATMKAYSEGLRALLIKTAYYGDQVLSGQDPEGRGRMLLDLFTPICKAYSTDKGFNVTELAIQTYGGYGYIREYPVEQYMRDVKIASLYEGTNGIQAMDLLGRKMSTQGGALFMTYLQDINTFIEETRADEVIGADVAILDGAKDTLAETAFFFAGLGRKEPEYPMLNSSPFLEMFGDVLIAHILLEQARVSLARLATIAPDAPDVTFYKNKVKTAKFFVNNILPRVQANATRIKAHDKSALEMEF